VGQINIGRYDHLLRRTTAQVGGGSKLGNALEDLFPVLEVENVPSELLRAVGWKLACGTTTRVPGAGQRSAIQLFNPAGSSHLITLTSVITTVNIATNINSGPSFDALTRFSIPGSQRDTRAGALAETVGLIQDEDDGLVANNVQIFHQANINFDLNDSNDVAVLVPGTGWRLTTDAINTSLRVVFLWRERVGEPEEFGF